MAFIVKW